MLAPIVAAALAAPFVIVAAWHTFRLLTTPRVTARHRLTAARDAYRPRAFAEQTGPVVIPGTPDPAATAVLNVTAMTAPVPTPAPDGAHAEALRENWARIRVAAAGKSWATHMPKFSGAVVPRPAPVPLPEWRQLPLDDAMNVLVDDIRRGAFDEATSEVTRVP